MSTWSPGYSRPVPRQISRDYDWEFQADPLRGNPHNLQNATRRAAPINVAAALPTAHDAEGKVSPASTVRGTGSKNDDVSMPTNLRSERDSASGA